MKLRDILKEVGEQRSAPYTVEPPEVEGNIYDPKDIEAEQIYKFNTGEDEYTVVLTGKKDEEKKEYFVDVDFFTEEGYGMTNAGKPLRVMATIAQIVKNVVDKDENKVIDGIVYGPAEKEGEDFDVDYGDTTQKASEDPVNQRDRLYRAFISKALKGNVEFFDQAGNIIAKFKKGKTKK